MPWHVAKSDQCPPDHPWAVIKTDSGEKVACHMTEEGAKRQVAALYANEPEAERAQLTAARINDLPDSAFAYIEPGGKKDEDGKTTPRSKRHFPIHDAAHVRNALARAPQSPFGEKAMPKIRAAAKKLGIGEPAERSQRLDIPFARSWAVDDIHILRAADGYGDGRTVEAYAAVFDTPTEITDQHGHYYERIDRTAFNMQLGLGIDRVGVYYHHGMTIHGTPSDLGSVPIGSPVDIRSDNKGLRTITRFNTTPLAESVLDAISHGDIKGYSFRGRIYKSSPSRVPRATRNGKLATVTRTEMGLTEYGPTPSPAYMDAGILAVRALQMLASTSPHGDQAAPPASSDLEPGDAEDQLDEQSDRQRVLRFRRAMRERGVLDNGT